ncbi:YwdI family protein [Oceanobacillus sp. 1P07AA]|uniref:YwdI family protein n=1 Tax=Oceanobacillus sp. 1P07AA TaxID=3132293 RepID=UPI0039A5B908
MSVSNETIINKMIAELEAAKREANNYSQLKKRMEHVRVLSELFDETHTPNKGSKVSSITTPKIVQDSDSESHFSEAEIKAMLGDTSKSNGVKTKKSFDDDANGDSLFDF